MTKTELAESVALAKQVLSALVTSVLGPPPTPQSAQLLWMCGELAATLQTEMIPPAVGAIAPVWNDLVLCFEQARTAGVSFAAMDTVRALISGFAPISPTAIAVTNFSMRMSLAEEAQMLAAMTFATREQIDGYLTQINETFFAAQDVAADAMDNVSYRALVSLHAAVVNDLSARALPLPRIVVMTFPARKPALTLAQTIYQDPGQTGELATISGVVHPAFMPLSFDALSAA
jgi:prophage DNA circulation protein